MYTDDVLHAAVGYMSLIDAEVVDLATECMSTTAVPFLPVL